MGLNYIIPPGNSNCGGGTYTDRRLKGLADDGGSRGMAPESKWATRSRSQAPSPRTWLRVTRRRWTAYLAARKEDAAVKAANKALNDLLTDDDERWRANRKDHGGPGNLGCGPGKANRGAFQADSVGAGPINMAGIAEWRAKFAVEDAVTAWNTAVGEDLRMADTALDGEVVNYADYVPLHNVRPSS